MNQSCQHVAEIKTLRTELKNLRDQIRGLRARHLKDISNLKEILSKPFQSKNVDLKELVVKPVGFVATWHQTKNGTPRQGILAQKAQGFIDFSDCNKFHQGFENPQFALQGLEDFSHVWILFHFHENNADGRNFIKTKVAPPRLKGSKVGLFSTRSPHRPNPIGLTLAQVIRIDGPKLYLQGLDLLDKTPIIDIKPYIPNYDDPNHEKEGIEKEEVKIPEWINGQGLKVSFTSRALESLFSLETVENKEALKQAIEDVLKEDPRSNYRREKCEDRLYFFNVDRVKVTCWFDKELAEVLKIEES